MTDIVRELRDDAGIADAGDHPEDGCRWAITMRAAAAEIERLREKVKFAVEWANGLPLHRRDLGGVHMVSVDDVRAFKSAMNS